MLGTAFTNRQMTRRAQEAVRELGGVGARQSETGRQVGAAVGTALAGNESETLAPGGGEPSLAQQFSIEPGGYDDQVLQGVLGEAGKRGLLPYKPGERESTNVEDQRGPARFRNMSNDDLAKRLRSMQALVRGNRGRPTPGIEAQWQRLLEEAQRRGLVP
jgi:hypothetical protein